jgi:RND family efflux transporter MFP subunit
MKKFWTIVAVVLVFAGMVALLVANKKKIADETAAIVGMDSHIPVQTIKVTTEAFSVNFASNGIAQAVKELNFVSNTQGRVVKIMAEKGDKVHQDQVLLKVDSELLEADYTAAKAAYEQMMLDEQRFTRSKEAGGVTQQQLDNIRTQLLAAESRMARARRMMEDATVKAPIAGTINMRYVEEGSLIAPNVPLFDIVSDSRLKVTCNVPESKVRLLSEGQTVTATTSTLPGKTFTGTIGFIGVKTDRGLNYPIEIILDENEELLIGMYMKVQFAADEQHSAILIPRKAIVGSAKSADVYTVADGKAYRHEVTLGKMVGNRVEVLSGLSDGDEVIVAGIMNIADGTEVTVVK